MATHVITLYSQLKVEINENREVFIIVNDEYAIHPASILEAVEVLIIGGVIPGERDKWSELTAQAAASCGEPFTSPLPTDVVIRRLLDFRGGTGHHSS